MNRENCRWELISDSLDDPVSKSLWKHILFTVAETQNLLKRKNEFHECSTTPQKLKQQRVKFHYLLEEQGVYFSSGKSNGKRIVEFSFCLVNKMFLPFRTALPALFYRAEGKA